LSVPEHLITEVSVKVERKWNDLEGKELEEMQILNGIVINVLESYLYEVIVDHRVLTSQLRVSLKDDLVILPHELVVNLEIRCPDY
jgi:hypothetical protein